jgi:hypothetical protein
MIPAPFLARLISLPPWAKGLGLIAVGIAGFLIWLHFHDRGVVRAHDSKVEAQVQAKASDGAVAASGAAADTVAGVEAGNQRMREAAAKSDDPLKAALDAGPK